MKASHDGTVGTTKVHWNNVTNKPKVYPVTIPRITTISTLELTTDEMIVCDCATPIVVTLLATTGSGRIRQIANVNAGDVTITPDGGDTINGDASKTVVQNAYLEIKDYITGKWLVK